MMYTSVVIPHYSITPEHDKALERCVSSIRGAGEIIIVANQGMGFGPACNLGIRLAKLPYVAILNNDLVLEDWSIDVMTQPNTVTFPIINGIVQEFSGAFLVIPRAIIDNELDGQVYDERFKVGYWEDVDLWVRLKEKNVPIFQKPFNVSHPSPGMTMRHMPQDTDYINRQIFLDKHGKFPIKSWS